MSLFCPLIRDDADTAAQEITYLNEEIQRHINAWHTVANQAVNAAFDVSVYALQKLQAFYTLANGVAGSTSDVAGAFYGMISDVALGTAKADWRTALAVKLAGFALTEAGKQITASGGEINFDAVFGEISARRGREEEKLNQMKTELELERIGIWTNYQNGAITVEAALAQFRTLKLRLENQNPTDLPAPPEVTDVFHEMLFRIAHERGWHIFYDQINHRWTTDDSLLDLPWWDAWDFVQKLNE